MSQCSWIRPCPKDAAVFVIATAFGYDPQPRDFCRDHANRIPEDWLKYDSKEERDLELLRRSL